MASAGLKRPSDFDLEYPSPHTSPKSNSVSPNSCQWSANKRRCITFANQSMMATQPQLANGNQTYISNVYQQSHQQAQQNQYHYPSHPTASTTSSSSSAPISTLASSPFKDPALILAPLCDDVSSIIKNEVHRAHHQQEHGQLQAQQHHQQQQQPHQSHQNHTSSPINYDVPTLSVRQTQAICEKIIREREQKLREEYDKILICKLAEQYDTFVKYTHDHIESRYNETNSHHASYLS